VLPEDRHLFDIASGMTDFLASPLAPLQDANRSPNRKETQE